MYLWCFKPGFSTCQIITQKYDIIYPKTIYIKK